MTVPPRTITSKSGVWASRTQRVTKDTEVTNAATVPYIFLCVLCIPLCPCLDLASDIRQGENRRQPAVEICKTVVSRQRRGDDDLAVPARDRGIGCERGDSTSHEFRRLRAREIEDARGDHRLRANEARI